LTRRFPIPVLLRWWRVIDEDGPGSACIPQIRKLHLIWRTCRSRRMLVVMERHVLLVTCTALSSWHSP
jgi:hypothetical protein